MPDTETLSRKARETELVDDFVEWTITNDIEAFDRTMFMEWVQRTYPERSFNNYDASMHLQSHRASPATRRYNISCNHVGYGARWRVVHARDVAEMEARPRREFARHYVREVLYRLEPTAAENPAVLAKMQRVESIMEGQLKSIDLMIAEII